MKKMRTKRRKLYKKRPMGYRTFKRVARPENKHFDVGLSQGSLNTGTLNLLTGIGQGVDDTQRVGNTLHLRSLYLSVVAKQNTISTIDTVRILVVRDRQNYNVPSVIDILESGAVGGGLAPLAQYNHYYMSRFKILFDRTFTLTSGGAEAYTFKKWIPIFSDSHYIGASTVFKNQIYLLHISDNGNILSMPVINISARIIYQDN